MGDVRRLWIEGPAGKLEAALRTAGDARGAAVLAHPHPQYGGTLHNPVIFHTDRELNRAGLTTLRFNFRGTGESEGDHDEGRGEVDDVAAAVSWLRGVQPDAPLLLVGYSFGVWCSLRYALDDAAIAGLVAIGLPVNIYGITETIGKLARPYSVVQGSLDEFGTPAAVRPIIEASDPAGMLTVVEGAAHLFPRRAGEVAGHVVSAVDRLLGGRPARNSADQ